MFESLGFVEPDGHVVEDDLILYADGELSPRKAARLQAHLEGCWPCRVRAEKYQQIISQLVDYVQVELAASQPPPPNSWGLFSAQLHKAVSQPNKTKGIFVLSALANRMWFWRGMQIASGAAVIAVLVILGGRFFAPPTVSGSELLRKSAGAEMQSLGKVKQPVIYQKLRIRSGRKSYTREIWRDTFNHRSKDNWQGAPEDKSSSLGSATSGIPPLELNDLRNTFIASNFSWENPLSAESYSDWCNHAALKSQEVVREEDYITLKTSIDTGHLDDELNHNSSGKVVSANLVLRSTDLHPISATLYVESLVSGKPLEHLVELAEVNYDVVPLSALGASLFESAPPAPVITHQPTSEATALPGPSPAELVDSEIAARFALHQISADLGLPITFSVIDQQKRPVVAVEGVVQSEARKQELVQVLSGIPHIKVNLKTEEEVSAHTRPGAVVATTTENAKPSMASPHSPIEKELMAYFQSQEAVEAFSEQTFATTESLMAHAWALRHLRERFANIESSSPSSLRPSSQKLMETMMHDLRDGMRTDAIALTKALEPVLFTPTNGLTAPNDSTLFDSAYRVERLTFYLLFGLQDDRVKLGPPDSAARDLLLELQRLCRELKPEE